MLAQGSETLPPIQSAHLLDGNRSFENCTVETIAWSRGFYYSDEMYLNLPKTPYRGYIYTKDANSELVYHFMGTEAAMYSNFRARCQIEYSIDGSDWKRINCSAHNPTIIVRNLESGRHVLKLRPIFHENTPTLWKIAAIFTRDEIEETRKGY